MAKVVTLTIGGVKVEAKEGETILNVAEEMGFLYQQFATLQGVRLLLLVGCVW